MLAKKCQARYIVTAETDQSHIILDLAEHTKDATNKVEYDIAVDKDYYDSVKVGDSICNEFRAGSFLFKGSAGDWNIVVKNKKIEAK